MTLEIMFKQLTQNFQSIAQPNFIKPEQFLVKLDKPTRQLHLSDSWVRLLTKVPALTFPLNPHHFNTTTLTILLGDYYDNSCSNSITNTWVNEFEQTPNIITILAKYTGLRIRIVDISAYQDNYFTDKNLKISQGKDINKTLNLTETELSNCFQIGANLLNQQVDSGANLALIAEFGSQIITYAKAIIGIFTNTEPNKLVNYFDNPNITLWETEINSIRHLMNSILRRHKTNPLELLSQLDNGIFASQVSFILNAALRKTPVIIDGIVGMATSIIAKEISPAVVNWLIISQSNSDPSFQIALKYLKLSAATLDSFYESGGVSATTCFTKTIFALNHLQ